MRGCMPLLSGRTSESGYCWPVTAPVGLLATTGACAANPGLISRFTRRPYFSTIGLEYSQRMPAFRVRPGLTRQSSVK